MVGFMLNNTVATVPKVSTASKIATGVTGGLASLLTNALGNIGNINKPEYKPEFYINANALFPNGVKDYTQQPQTAVSSSGATGSNSGINSDLLLYGGLGLGAVVLVFLLKK